MQGSFWVLFPALGLCLDSCASDQVILVYQNKPKGFYSFNMCVLIPNQKSKYRAVHGGVYRSFAGDIVKW